MKPVLLMTRPNPASERFARAVQDALGEPVDMVHAPAFEIVPLGPKVPESIAQVIFTSVNGVAQAVRLDLPKVTAWCVGDKTAAAARHAGFATETAGGNAEDLIALITTRRPKGRMAHIAGEHTRGDIEARLQSVGFDCVSVTAYSQRALAPTKAMLSLVGGTRSVVAPVFSPRSAHILTVPEWQGTLHAVVMSGAVAEELANLGCDTVTVAKQPTEAAMISATTALFRDLFDR